MKELEEITKFKKNAECVRQKLIDFSATRNTVSYQDLSNIAALGLDMRKRGDVKKISDLLCWISSYELKRNRPLLSAIVVKSKKKMRGDGFFELCIIKEEELKEFLKCGVLSPKIDQKERFSKARIRDCHNFWRKKSNLHLRFGDNCMENL